MTKRRSAIFEAGDIVRVPFPFVERDEERVRPALIVATAPLGRAGDLFWALMITSERDRERWPGDIPLGPDHREFGLPVPCMIRTAKLSTLSIDAIDRRLGRLPDRLAAEVRARLVTNLGLAS